MASTFRELYSDFQTAVRLYSEKLQIDEKQFMRLYTRGLQKFQRETEFWERQLVFTKAAQEPYYTLPIDCLRIKQIKTMSTGDVIARLAHPQGDEQRDVYDIKDENNIGYEVPLSDYHKGFDITDGSIRWSVYDNEIRFSPYEPDTILIFYAPDIPAFGSPIVGYSYYTYWDAWFTNATAFQTQFETSRLNPILAPYEEAFLNYAIGLYVKSAGSPNFKEYENQFRADVEFAKTFKPDYSHSISADYNLAPWS